MTYFTELWSLLKNRHIMASNPGRNRRCQSAQSRTHNHHMQWLSCWCHLRSLVYIGFLELLDSVVLRSRRSVVVVLLTGELVLCCWSVCVATIQRAGPQILSG